MAILKQSTTYTRMFLLVQSSDHVSPLTGASPSVSLSKAGGSFASAGGTITEVANGFYKIALTTTDTNTLGDLAFHITATSGDNTDFVDQIAANILGDTLPANATQINGVSTASVATINANLGTTQPINFTGTAGSALTKSDMVDIAGAAVSASTAQVGVNLVNVGGSALSTHATGMVPADVRDIGGVAVSTTTPQLGVNVAGYATGQAPLQPTTAGRTLDVNANGNAGIDWGNIDAPTTVVDLSGTTIKNLDGNTVQTGDAFARLGAPAGLSVSADIAALKSDLDGGVKIASYATGQDPATLVLDVAASSHNTAGTIGAKINSAGSAADPWATALPGSYTSGQAGFILGTNLDALISSRAAPSDILTTALTESYSTLHTAPTLSQALFQMISLLQEKAASGTTLTAKKIDGSTTAMSFTITLDGSGNATALTRTA